MECVPENGQIRAYTSWTLPRPSPGVTRQGVVSKLNDIANRLLRIETNSNECFFFIFVGYFSLKTLLDFWMHHIMMVLFIVVLCVNHDRMSSAENSIWSIINIICLSHPAAVWNVRAPIQIQKLANYWRIILVVVTIIENSVGYHDIGFIASGSPRYLAEVSAVGAASKLFLRLHAAFMITAWIGTASVGILLARYFKQTWVGSQLCGKDQWFAVSLVFYEFMAYNSCSRLKWMQFFSIDWYGELSVASIFHDSHLGSDYCCICTDIRWAGHLVIWKQSTRNSRNDNDDYLFLATIRSTFPSSANIQQATHIQLASLACRQCGTHYCK